MVVVHNCDGANEAGATVTVKTRTTPSTVAYTGTTAANGQISTNLPGNTAYTLIVNAAQYDYTVNFSIGFSLEVIDVSHPLCGWLTQWGQLYITDPWGVLPLVNQNTATRYVTCPGIATPKDFDPNFPNDCSRAKITSIQAKVIHNLVCNVVTFPAPAKYIRVESYTYQCGIAGSNPDIPGYSTPVWSDNPAIGVTDPHWSTGGAGESGNMRFGFIALSAELPLCGQNAHNPPDLSFPGLDYSDVGGPGSFTAGVSI